MLCASCAIVDASAPVAKPEPADEAEADPAGAEVALDDGDLREVPLGVRDDLAVASRRLFDERLGDDLVGHDADHAHPAARGTQREVARRGRRGADGVLDPLRHRGTLDLADGRPRFSTSSGSKRSRSGRRSRSAW